MADNSAMPRRKDLKNGNSDGVPPDSASALEAVLNNPLLPQPPVLALQLVEKVSDSECEIEDVCAALERDPLLCGRLLKVVNSAYYAPAHPVTSIHRAVVILGLRRLRSLVLSLVLPAIQLRGDLDDGLKSFWCISVSGALITRELAARLKRPGPEDDMVASLLRDVGMILLQQTFPTDYRPVWTGQFQHWAGRQCEWEQEHVGISHAEVGAVLLKRWRLPDEIVEPIRHHHSPRNTPSNAPQIAARARLLDFTGRLAESAEIPHSQAFLEDLIRQAREDYDLEWDTLQEFLISVSPKIEEFAANLSVDIGSCPRFSAILSAGCEELVRLSLDTQDTTGAASTKAVPDTDVVGLGPAGKGEPNRLKGSGVIRELWQFTPGTRVLDYEITRLIGQGGMGAVFEAQDLSLSRRVALKVLLPERMTNPNARPRFVREARMVAAIHHENVVAIHGIHEVNGLQFLVMEYVDGMSIDALLEAGRTFTPPEVVRIGFQIASGLAAAHALRMIHRDIKPANILLERGTDFARITDFGLARVLDEGSKITQEGALVGTPQFMSPEQFEGAPLSPASDLFSLGSLLYTLCTRRLPFDGASIVSVIQAVTMKTPPSVKQINEAIPEWLAVVVERLMAKNPADRYGSAVEVATLLHGHMPKANSPVIL